MKQKGFTLVELMVTITIMMIMTAVILFNYNQFNDSSALNSLAYDLSLTIRQAQVYGVAVRQGSGVPSAPITVADAGSTNFKYAYGVHFVDSTVTAPYPLILFTALVVVVGQIQTVSYDPGGAGDLQEYSFQRGIKISQLCVTDGSGEHCGVSNGITTLDITFKRPDPEATIVSSNSTYTNISSARIVLSSTGNSPMTKSVVVYSTGQISVQ